MLNTVAIVPGHEETVCILPEFLVFSWFSPPSAITTHEFICNDLNLICRIVRGLSVNEFLRIKKVNALNTLLSDDGDYVINKYIGDKRQWIRIRIIWSAALTVEQKTEYFMIRFRAFQNVENAKLS